VAITTLFLTGVEISARMYRGLVTDLFGEGIRNVAAGEFQVIPRALGANMTVTVRKGTGPDAVAYIVGDDVAGQGTYRVTQDADFLDLGIAAAPASGTRNDLVVLETVDSQVVGGTTNFSRLRVLTGVSALTSEKTVIPLARISVPTGTTSIQAANITDLRTGQAGGGATVRTAAQPLSAAAIAALTGMRIGDITLNTDTGRLQYWNGTAWKPAGGAAVGTVSIGSLTMSGAFTTYAYFIGLGFETVRATFISREGVSNDGFQINVYSDPARAQGIGSGGTSGGVAAFAATSSSSSQTFYINNTQNSMMPLTIRNARLDADGYLRYELNQVSGQSPAAGFRFNWEAR
jgi:hypothetical protein